MSVTITDTRCTRSGDKLRLTIATKYEVKDANKRKVSKSLGILKIGNSTINSASISHDEPHPTPTTLTDSFLFNYNGAGGPGSLVIKVTFADGASETSGTKSVTVPA